MLVPDMKNTIGLVVLAVICLGLGIALVSVKNKAAEEKQASGETILDLSNKLVVASGKLDDQRQVNAVLEKDLESRKTALTELTNKYTDVSANLAQTTAELTKTTASLQASQAEVAKRDTKISELENQNQLLDRQAVDLTTALTNLTSQIADTQKRLSASEGDKAFLEKELKRLIAEKAELERQFNDLTVLRAQVAKLKEELNIARRIEWIRQGIFANSDQKGAQKLMQGNRAPQTPAKAAKPAYDLNVEVSADGSVKVIPPLSARPDATNAPPAK
jgi:chromosome segregation ATPase